MNIFKWIADLFKPKPPVPMDEQPGLIGDILRIGEAAGGDAQAAEAEQQQADGNP